MGLFEEFCFVQRHSHHPHFNVVATLAVAITTNSQFEIYNSKLTHGMENKMRFLPNKWKIFGALIGAIGGYFYWSEIGCLTGTCPLKSQWQTMVPYGAILGFTISGIITDILKKK